MTKTEGPTRRSVLTGAGAAVMAAAAVTHSAEATPSPERKMRSKRNKPLNILFICTDQERSWTDFPETLPLPARDWFREHGTEFVNYHVNTAPCGPSRSIIYTGQHTQHTGVYLNPNSPPQPQLKPEMETIGDMLREAGYRTYYKGKWHLTNINEGRNFSKVAGGLWPNTKDVLEEFGFSDYNFDGEHEGLTWQGFINDPSTAAASVNVLERLAADKSSKPWFLAVNFINPHDIMFYDATGKAEQTRKTPNAVAPMMHKPGDPVYAQDWKFPLPKSFYADDLSTKPMAQRALLASLWSFYARLDIKDEASWLNNLNYYYNCARDVQRHVMTVLAALERTGQMDNTVIIYTSDHGERAGAHRLRQKGGTMYREDLGVPFAIVHPDLKGGVQTEALGTTLDIVPTLLGFAGLTSAQVAKRHPQLKGYDLSAALRDTSARTARDAAGILLNYAVGYGWGYPDVPRGVEVAEPLPKPDLKLRRLFRGVHSGRYKFARYFAPAQHHTPVTFEQLTAYNDLELYDVSNDREEIVNLAAEPEKHRALLMQLNEMTNALIAREVGTDNGSEYPGPLAQYNTLTLS